MPSPPNFNPADSYWAVAGSTAQVYSSATGNYVLVTDPTYVAWRTVPGNILRTSATEADLGKLLATYLQRPVAAGVLDGYQDKMADGVIIMAAFKIMFQHENRIRAIERALSLNGSPPNLTPAQAKAAVKALM